MVKSIQWSVEERTKIKTFAIELFVTSKFNNSLLIAMKCAQSQLLSAERQRVITGVHQVLWLHPDHDINTASKSKAPPEFKCMSTAKVRVPALVARARAYMANAKAPAQAPVQAVHVPEVATLDALAMKTEEIKGVLCDAVTVIQHAACSAARDIKASTAHVVAAPAVDNAELIRTIDALPTKIATAIADQFMNSEFALHILDLMDFIKGKAPVQAIVESKLRIPQEVELSFPVVEDQVVVANTTPDYVETAKVKRSDKKMLLFINMFPNNWQVVSRTYGGMFDVRNWDGRTDGIPSLERLARNAHRVYANTDVLTHPQDDKLCQLAKDKYVRYTGSTSKLKRILETELSQSII